MFFTSNGGVGRREVLYFFAGGVGGGGDTSIIPRVSGRVAQKRGFAWNERKERLHGYLADKKMPTS